MSSEEANRLSAHIAEKSVLLVDGATGTELFARGLEAGDAPERMNLDNVAGVHGLHEAYASAGSDIVLTNTFGGNRFRLKLHKLDDRVEEINQLAASHARHVVDQITDRRVLVAGSVGPSGELLVPLGELDANDARQGFAEQAAGLAAGGADLIWIETMSSLEEGEAAVRGAQDSTDLPIAITMSFDTAGRTMMGVTGTAAAEHYAELGVTAIGANCGNNLADTEAAVAQIRAAAPEVHTIAKANAGIPEWRGAELCYSGTPEIMAAHAIRMRDLGVEIIGGCCGNTPAHIALMRGVLDGRIPVPMVAAEAPTARVSRDASRRRRRRG